jgi:hypothetical protein
MGLCAGWVDLWMGSGMRFSEIASETRLDSPVFPHIQFMVLIERTN